MSVAAPSMEDPLAPAGAEPDKHEGLEPQIFNQDSREALEDAFEEFQTSESEPAPVSDPAPAEPDKQAAADSGEPVAPLPLVEDPAPTGVTSFKTKAESDRAYLEARNKMNEATTRASQLQRERDDAERRAGEAINLVIRAAQQGGRRSEQAQVGEPPAGMTKEELEHKFFEDPVGFSFALAQAMNQDAVAKAEAKFQATQRQAAIDGLTQNTQSYFDEKFPELKAVEPLVTEEIKQVWNDPDIIGPIMRNPNLRVDAKAKAVIEEAGRRVREKFPGLLQATGPQGDGKTSTERLKSGGTPVIPASGSRTPIIRPGATENRGETGDEYITRREASRERMQATRMTR